MTNANINAYTFDKATELATLLNYVPSEVIIALGYTGDELLKLGFGEERIATLSHQRAEFDAKQTAQEAAEQFERETIERGKTLLDRLSSQNPTHGELRALIEADHAMLMASVEQ